MPHYDLTRWAPGRMVIVADRGVHALFALASYPYRPPQVPEWGIDSSGIVQETDALVLKAWFTSLGALRRQPPNRKF